MRAYRKLLSIMAVAAAVALSGCETGSRMTSMLRPGGNEGQRPADMQMSRDPVGPEDKVQVGIHWDPRMFTENAFGPERLSERLTAPAFSGITRQSFAEVGGDHHVNIDLEGRSMLYSTTRYSVTPKVCVQSTSGKSVQLLTDDNMSDMMPRFHPARREVAWCSNRSGNWDIWMMRIDDLPNKKITQLTQDSDDDIHPTWSHDGKLLAFSRFNSMDGLWQIWIMDVENRTVSHITEGLFPEFSPVAAGPAAGTYRIAYQRNRNRDVPFFSVWSIDVRMDRDGKVQAVSAPEEIVASSEWAAITPAWSPDGEYLVFATVRKSPLTQYQARLYKADDIYVVRRDGTDITQITRHSAPDWDPYWAKDPNDPDGCGRIYFISSRLGHANVYSVKPLIPGLLAKAAAERPAQ